MFATLIELRMKRMLHIEQLGRLDNVVFLDALQKNVIGIELPDAGKQRIVHRMLSGQIVANKSQLLAPARQPAC